MLVGKRLAIWRRVVNMLVFQFGYITREADKSWCEYALHVQCPWRLLKDGAIFTGLSDLYSPREETADFDWCKWHADSGWPDNLLEHQLSSLLKQDLATCSLENVSDLLVVEKVEASGIGDARVHLSGGYIWECYPVGIEREYWRLLDNVHRKHFAVCGESRTTANKSVERTGAPPLASDA